MLILLLACAPDEPPEKPADTDTSAFVATTEVCDGVDNDCDGVADEVEGFADADGDGWGDADRPMGGCDAGAATLAGDCDDHDAAMHPDVAEVCDGVDQDCDGEVDEGLPETDAWWDEDGDGYGAGEPERVCEGRERYVLAAGDCDEADAAVHPGAEEACNGVDDDCDGVGDVDADGDGHLACADCDDAAADVYPGAPERCDGLDNDCDGATPAEEADADGDSHLVCGGDCDDTDARTAPGYVELCDGADDDCDGEADDDCVTCDVMVPGDAATVQGGIDAAAGGDIVCVAPGTWVEHVDFEGKALTLLGVGGADGTVLEADLPYTSVVSFVSGEGPGAVLRDFTVRGASYESGIQVEDSSPTLERLLVTGNTWAWFGGGIGVRDGDPVLAGVRVFDNSAAHPSTDGFTDGWGGGIYLSGSHALLDGVRVESNYASSSGGGIYVVEGAPALTNVVVVGNSGEYYGGGLQLWRDASTLDGVLVAGNEAPNTWWIDGTGGGVAFRSSSTARLRNVVITGNEAYASGGGVYVDDTSTPTLVNVIVEGNVAGTEGGGVYVERRAPSMSYCDVWSNDPDDFSGMSDPTGSDGNVSVDPMFVDAASHLDPASPLVDAGDPSLADPDGSRSDIGLWGGATADRWDLDDDGSTSWWLPGLYDATTSPGADCDDGEPSVFWGSGC